MFGCLTFIILILITIGCGPCWEREYEVLGHASTKMIILLFVLINKDYVNFVILRAKQENVKVKNEVRVSMHTQGETWNVSQIWQHGTQGIRTISGEGMWTGTRGKEFYCDDEKICFCWFTLERVGRSWDWEHSLNRAIVVGKGRM